MLYPSILVDLSALINKSGRIIRLLNYFQEKICHFEVYLKFEGTVSELYMYVNESFHIKISITFLARINGL